MDPTRIREYLVYEVYNKMGVETQKYWLGNLKIGNEDKGLMTVVEVISEDYVGYKYNNSEGDLYKPEKSSNSQGDFLHYVDDDEKSYTGLFKNIKTSYTDEEDKKELISILKKIKEAKTLEEIENNFVDFERIIKIVAINKAVGNIDSFMSKTGRNYFLYETNGKIDILPYDFNISLGLNPMEFFWTEEEVHTFEFLELQEKRYSIILEIIKNNEEYYAKYEKYLRKSLKILKKLDIDSLVEGQNLDGIEELKEFIYTRNY